MQKTRIKNGLIVYKVTTVESTALGGYGICDECNTAHAEGYLIPVLNHWMCQKCFDDWKSRCRNYPEDAPIESKNCEYYESIIPITEWPTDCKDCPCSSKDGKCMELNPSDGTPPCDHMDFKEFTQEVK